MAERFLGVCDARVPELHWRRAGWRDWTWVCHNVLGTGRPFYSSGRTYFSLPKGSKMVERFVVTAGTNRDDQHITLLHEVAHGLTPGHHHDATFWHTAWDLYLTYAPGVPVRRVLAREGAYRREALVVATELGVRGAVTALHNWSRRGRR